MARTATPPNTTKLGDFLCFAVYSANLAFGRAYRPILDKVGLTYTQYVALVALGEEENQTVGDLGDRLFLESNTLTPILKKLETLGLVERRRNPADERQVRVNLTAAGRKLRQQVEANASDLIGATGLGDDFGKVQRTVSRLRDNLLRSTGAADGKAEHES
jgi:DNA-binding MarR family transcriptional regulator